MNESTELSRLTHSDSYEYIMFQFIRSLEKDDPAAGESAIRNTACSPFIKNLDIPIEIEPDL